MKAISLEIPECVYEVEEHSYYKNIVDKNVFHMNYDMDLIYGYFEDDFPEEKIQKLLSEKLEFQINYLEKDLNKMKNYLNELKGEN